MLRLIKKPILINFEKQTNLPNSEKSDKAKADRIRIVQKTWYYQYNLIDFIIRILNVLKLKNKIYFGMAKYIDYLEKFWESRVQGLFVIITSKNFVCNSKNDIILPEDIVKFIQSISG